MLHGWFWPVCASSLAVVSSGEEVEHSWVEGALEFSSGGRRLMPWRSGREFTLAAGVIAVSYKKVKSGGVPDVTPPMIKSVWLSIYDPLLRRGASAFIVGVTGRSYLRSLMHLLLTMPSFASTSSVVLAAWCAFCLPQLWQVDLTCVRSALQSLGSPCLCQVDFAMSDRPYCVESTSP
ncbi:hypothetical protein B296_00037656 [Ensete ventricosum]|uniref:Secreted protein n=1 Tax=Ensete ventricosum TaxID=4639 RepID=A0A426ZE80_ENSVE|nr:hypothetical protein B296_00037656 [Ensete ventricosum]